MKIALIAAAVLLTPVLASAQQAAGNGEPEAITKGKAEGRFVLTNPTWMTAPSQSELDRVYPPQATLDNKEGMVHLRCRVEIGGGIDGCDVLDEAPTNYGFGSAAVSVAHLFATTPDIVAMNPDNGEPITVSSAGSVVEFAVNFHQLAAETGKVGVLTPDPDATPAKPAG